MWILCHRKTKTNHRIYILGMTISPYCQICGYHSEEITYIFFKCYIATKFWKEVHLNGQLQINIDGSSLELTTLIDCWKWIKHKKCLTLLNWYIFFPYCLWQIWKNKNSNVFEHKVNPVHFRNTFGLATKYAALRPNGKAICHAKSTVPSNGPRQAIG